MKKQTKSKPKVVKELASQFEAELKNSMPVTVLPNGNIVYKDFVIKKTKQENWAVYFKYNNNVVDEYHLKTCALLSAKAYDKNDLNRFFEIKNLDNQYWASYSDNQVYQHNIKKAKDFDRYIVLLNKLEDSQARAEHLKEQISRMFKWSFV
jgi:hypothetical protein